MAKNKPPKKASFFQTLLTKIDNFFKPEQDIEIPHIPEPPPIIEPKPKKPIFEWIKPKKEKPPQAPKPKKDPKANIFNRRKSKKAPLPEPAPAPVLKEIHVAIPDYIEQLYNLQYGAKHIDNYDLLYDLPERYVYAYIGSPDNIPFTGQFIDENTTLPDEENHEGRLHVIFTQAGLNFRPGSYSELPKLAQKALQKIFYAAMGLKDTDDYETKIAKIDPFLRERVKLDNKKLMLDVLGIYYT